jgi:hypothetical protein
MSWGPVMAQPCYSGYQYDHPGCPGLQNVNAMPNTPNATNTYVWPTNPAFNTYLVSGQGTQNAVYYFGATGHITINVQVTSSQYGCTYTMVQHYYVAQYSTPDIQGTIPVNCPGPQVSTYYATRWQDGPGTWVNHREQHFWTVNGGTITSQSTGVTLWGSMYGWSLTDTIKVLWNGSGPRSIILQRYANDNNNNVPTISSCYAYDTLYPAYGPATITGPASACAPLTASYTVNPDTGYTYLWSVTGGGSIVSGQGTTNVQVNWTGSGTLSVTKSFIWCPMTYTASLTFTQNTIPAPNLGPNGTFCQGSGFTLNAGPGQTYAWSTGATTQTITPTASGTYTVTVSNGPGCTGTSSVTLTMLSAPSNPTISASPISACQGTPVTLSAGIWTAYLWSTGATTASITVTTSGTYSVTVTDVNGCQASGTIFMSFLPSPTPNLPSSQTVCANAPIALNPGSFVSYNWSTGATTPTITPTTGGTYSVTVTDGNGCTGTASTTLIFLSPPAPNLGPNQSVCTGTVVTLNPGSFSSYLWSNGATTPTITTTTAGTYEVTVTSSNGCTGDTSMTLTLFPSPSFSLGNDTIICADTTLQLDGPVGMTTYAWSSGLPMSSIVIATGGNYALTVTDANGCQASDSRLITGLSDCIFPGDANYDGVADNLDILSIGAYYGYAGAARPGATTQWYGQALLDWGGALPGQADPKHSDCDGSGLVQAPDTLAVTANYGQTHSKATGTTTVGAALRVVAMIDTVAPGDIAWFLVELGDALDPVDSVYGLAFTVSYAGASILAPGLLQVDYANCWFAGAGNRIPFTYNHFPATDVDLAVVRTDQASQVGFGEVCRFGIRTDSNLVPVSDLLTVSLSEAWLVDAGLWPSSVAVIGDTVVVHHNVLGDISTAQPLPPRAFPNPANDIVRVAQPNAEIVAVQVMDINGRVLAQHLGDGSQQLQLSTSDLSAGVYFLQVQTSLGQYRLKLAICR